MSAPLAISSAQLLHVLTTLGIDVIDTSAGAKNCEGYFAVDHKMISIFPARTSPNISHTSVLAHETAHVIRCLSGEIAMHRYLSHKRRSFFGLLRRTTAERVEEGIADKVAFLLTGARIVRTSLFDYHAARVGSRTAYYINHHALTTAAIILAHLPSSVP